MTRSSSPHIAVWKRRRCPAPAQAFTPGLVFVLAVVTEFRRAAAATHRYERLKYRARTPGEPAVDAARQIFVEFYSDE
jgi:hypothetical protein